MRSIFNLFLLTLLFSSCNSDVPEAPTKTFTISLGELSDIDIVNDEFSYIDGSVYTYEKLDGDRAIISDQKPGLYLLNDNKMIAQFGRSGAGPCEYASISGTDIAGNKLYVLDSSQAKIITFDIDTRECLDEFTNEGVTRFNYLHKLTNEEAFIIGNADYMGLMPDNTELLRKVYADGTYEDLGFKLGRINTVNSVVRLRTPGMEFVESENKLYSYFPLTDSLHWYDISSSDMHSFPINIEIKREEIEDATSDPQTMNVQEILDIINSGYTFVTRILVTDKWIALATSQNQPGEEPPIRLIKFYSPEGAFLGEIPFESNVLGLEKGRLIQIIENSDPNAEFAYSIGYRDVIIK